jgi:hypothetical protein
MNIKNKEMTLNQFCSIPMKDGIKRVINTSEVFRVDFE